MKSVVYNYINRFWDGKSFLLRSNAKKDMREQFEIIQKQRICVLTVENL